MAVTTEAWLCADRPAGGAGKGRAKPASVAQTAAGSQPPTAADTGFR